MTKLLIPLALAVTGASAFTAPDNASARSAVCLGESKADLQDMAAKLNPVLKFWDPLGKSRDVFCLGLVPFCFDHETRTDDSFVSSNHC
jgi:hypothetical protein